MRTARPILPVALTLFLVLAGCGRIQALREVRALSDSTQADTTDSDVTATRDANGRPAAMLSAFFGLDDALPRLANRGLCEGAKGKDGMPVIFSHEIDLETLQAGDFRVTTTSGAVGEIICVTPAPAIDPGEIRTILFIGQYGSADDEPASVEVVGNVLSMDGSLNFKGTRVEVTALEPGPSMVFAEMVPESEWELGKSASRPAAGSSCPVGTAQVVRVVWAGGITKPGGDEVDDNERAQYRVTVQDADGRERSLVPFAMGDLGDRDNNHELCLDTTDKPIAVQFEAGFVTDPREDLNPRTRIAVTR